jgi:hypothetical protein
MQQDADDVKAIRVVIARQFASLSWSHGQPGNWGGFSSDFHAAASLFPSARPATPQSVQEFVDRMKALLKTSLPSFQEKMLGSEVRVFGNIAVATAAVEITENEAEVNRSVEMMLFGKSQGAWQIVSQAWDKASSDNPIPLELQTP